MTRMRRSLVTLLLLAASCARPSASSETGPQPARDPNVISKEEMQSLVVASMDAMQAIRYLRPAFFRTTGPQSFVNGTAGNVQFSQDYGPLRPVGQLATLRLDFLYEVRYLDANQAQNRFGLNANGGPVIVLLSNKQ